MGSGDYGPRSYDRSFRDNEELLINEFRVNKSGLFGHAARSKGVRQIDSHNPLETAIRFADVASQGGRIIHELKNGGYVKRLSDGSIITFRPSSKSVSPAVDLSIVDSVHVVSQKIHFEED